MPPALILSMHMVHFTMAPVFSFLRGMRYGQASRSTSKSFSAVFSVYTTAPVASS